MNLDITRRRSEMVKKEQMQRDAIAYDKQILFDKHRWVVEIEMKEGVYVRDYYDHNRENLGFIPFQKDSNGLNRLDGDVLWNNNRDIRLSLQRDKRGPFIKMEGKINARAYLEEAKPFHELKWELEREKDLLRNIDRERERTLER